MLTVDPHREDVILVDAGRDLTLTYAELVARTKAGGLLSQGFVYHTLGLIDCGNPEIFLGLVKESMKSEAHKERLQQLVLT